MIASFVLVAAALAAPDSHTLLRADFDDSTAPLVAVPDVACAGGRIELAAGSNTSFSAPGPFVGDVVLEVEFASAYQGELSLGLRGSPDFEARITATGCSLRSAAKQIEGAAPASFRSCRVVLRSHAAELLVDGVSVAFAEFTRPIGGGSFALEIAPLVAAALDRVSVQSLPFPNRDQVEGLDAERLVRLAALPAEKFRLLESNVARIDPVYRIGVEGEETPIVVRGRGIRPDAAELSLLEQALALARIRPWLDFEFFDGEARPEDKPLAPRESGGPLLITTPPGVIRVRALCGVTDQWPVVVVMDATRDRVLARFNPSGPSTGEAWAMIPPKCDRVRVALVVPGGATYERFVDLARP
jgi:hypothetical protein